MILRAVVVCFCIERAVVLIWLALVLRLWLRVFVWCCVLMAFFAGLTVVGVSINSVVHWYL